MFKTENHNTKWKVILGKLKHNVTIIDISDLFLYT